MASLLLAPALAAAPFVAPEGTQPGGLAGAAPPADVNSECGSCHSGSRDDNDRLFRPYDTWGGTMMANAARDPLYLAALSVAEQDAPGVGAYCWRCHTPKGFVKGHALGLGEQLDADDMQGVECEGCHRSIDGSKVQPELMHDGSLIGALEILDHGAPYIGNARLIWDPRDVRHGPHADADSPAHAASPNAFLSSSEFCGQCHELQSPARTLLDDEGNDTQLPFPLDTTYSEWKASSFASTSADSRSCIDCHMRRAVASAATTASFPSAAQRENPRTHVLVGGNEWGIDAVMAAYPTLAKERAASFELAKSATRALLAEAVTLDISTQPASAGDTSVHVSVRVTNRSGHKFPTGYADGRRAFLQVELTDSNARTLAIIGQYDEATQSLRPDPQLRVWEAVQAEHLPNGAHHEWHLVKNDLILKDTRIPPEGMSLSGTSATLLAPRNADYGPLSALRHYDDVKLHFSGLPPLSAAPLRVTARVFYQSTVREFIDELERENVTDSRGTTLRAIWEQTGKAAPRLIQSATHDLQVQPKTEPNDARSSGDGCSCRVRGNADSPRVFQLLAFALGALALCARRRAFPRAVRR
ncbi:MAG: multiheme c-type cytochrome [Myxococcota bacterium]